MVAFSLKLLFDEVGQIHERDTKKACGDCEGVL